MQNQFSGRARLGDGSARSSEKPKRMWSVRKGESVNRMLLLGCSGTGQQLARLGNAVRPAFRRPRDGEGVSGCGWRPPARAAELDAAAGCAKVE
jgi:hypothetical protein